MFLPVRLVPGLGLVPGPEPVLEPVLELVRALVPVLELVPRRPQASSRRLTMPAG